jgi:hypothetical protein
MIEKPTRKPFVPPSSREEEIFSRLQEAEDLIRYATDVDHYCEDPKCTLDNPQCRDRHAEAGLREIRRLLDPPHISLQPKRLTNDAERIYAERWRKENERRPAINSGFTALEWILCPSDQRVPERATLRDAVVAASIIQWLGTNVGHCFVMEAEKRIEEARVRHSKWRQLEHKAEYEGGAFSAEIASEAEQLVGKLWSVLPPEEVKLREAMQKATAAALAAAEARGAASARDQILAALQAGTPASRPLQAPGEESHP